MFDEPFRKRFSTIVRPLVPPLAHVGLTPNHITGLTFVLGIVAAILIAFDRPFIGIAIWLLSRIGDGFDGALARYTGRTTAFGGYLDITLDMGAYAAMVVGFSVRHPALDLAWMAVLVGYVLVITTTLALSDAGRSAGRQVSATDRTFQFTAGFTEAGETTAMYLAWVLFPDQVFWLVWVWVAALAATSVQRTCIAARLLR